MRFLVGLLVGIAVVLAAEFLFLTQGGMPAAARNAKPLPLEAFLTNRALEVAVERSENRSAPIPADEQNLVAGARVYRENCIACHGGPGGAGRMRAAEGMFPQPPKLMPPSKGVTDDPVGETFWKVSNGIRLTGMPSFAGVLSETAMWQVSLLLLKADHLPDAATAALR